MNQLIVLAASGGSVLILAAVARLFWYSKKINRWQLQIEAAQCNAYELLETAIETSPHGFALVSVEPLGRFVSVNDRLCDMFGMDRQELLDSTFQELTHPDDLDKDLANIADLMAGRTGSYVMEKRYLKQKRTDETYIKDSVCWWGYLSVGLLPASPTRSPILLAQIVDIDAHKREAMLDALCSTGKYRVCSRKYILDQLNQAVDARFRLGRNTCLIIFDLDGFKAVNDTHGHLTGDELLRQVSSRVLDVVENSGSLGRPGGDEFWIILPGVDAKQGYGIALKILQVINTPFTIRVKDDEQSIQISASIGVADLSEFEGETNFYIPEQGLATEAEEFVSQADAAAMEAKHTGKNKVVASSADIHSHWALINEIENGIRLDQFCLWFQPIISLENNYVAGYEALVRWKHPQRGFLNPGEFVPALEENGDIYKLCRFVLQAAALKQNELTARGSSKRINVNVSPLSLSRQRFIEDIAAPLIGTRTKVEVTELIQLNNDAEIALSSLKSQGTEICLDDMGSGDRGLGQMLKVNCIKLDRINLVANVTGSTQPICKALIDLAHNLNPRLDVVAEGVETQAQLATLQALGCDYIQGHLFAQAMPWDEAEAWTKDYESKLS